MNTGILLSVREKAKRLPGKVLKPLGEDANVTQFLLRRLKGVHDATVILATSDDPRDAVLCEIAAEEGASCFRGSQDDKLMRYRDCARAHGLDFLVIVDGDDPFVSTSHIERMLDYACNNPCDMIMFDNLALGATGFGLRVTALEAACIDRAESNTEVWGSIFKDNPAFTCIDLHEEDPVLARPEVRMTLDYQEDYDFFTTVMAGIGAPAHYEDVMAYLAEHPQTIEINRGVQETYEAHLQASQQ